MLNGYTLSGGNNSVSLIFASSCNGLTVKETFRTSLLLKKWGGWLGGATVLGNLPVPGRPTNFDYSRTRAYCTCSRCGRELFGHFYSRLSFLFSFSFCLWGRPDID